MESLKVCAIIVTFNRKEWLLRCVKAVLAQSFKPSELIIVDNASTDGTSEYLAATGTINNSEITADAIVNVSNSDSNIKYFRLSNNQGGAGGFYWGLKLAHASGEFDAFWLMDDDGYPSGDCLERQLPYLSQYDYVMPVSIDIDNHTRLSWATKKKDGTKTEILEELQAEWGSVMPFIIPFNGSLLSKKLVDTVGYINPKLFIWGDDYEHYFRCLRSGFTPITVLNAEFYHPVNKAPTVPIIGGRFQVPYVDSELRFVCLIRNWAYINKKNRRFLHLFKSLAAYSWLFLFTQKFNWSKYRLFLASYWDGLTNNFERHKRYLK